LADPSLATSCVPGKDPDRFSPCVPAWSTVEPPASPSAGRRYTQALQRLAASPEEPLAIDVRLPFCAMLCLYCGYDVSAPKDGREIDHYLDALEREMDLVCEHLGTTRDVVQLHLGGGTPNHLSDAQLARVVSAVMRRFRLLGESERSIVYDPRLADPVQLERMRALGFGEVALGVADLQPEVQRAVGRFQSSRALAEACELAVKAGFDSVAIDTVYGLPGQTAEGYRATLRAILDMGPDRVRCRQYNHRPQARRHQTALGAWRLPSAAECHAMLDAAVETLTEAGYVWIGHDAFALDTDEMAIAQAEKRLRCNAIGYTIAPAAHVLGFGSGARSEVDGAVVRNHGTRASWQQRVENGRLPVAHARRRTPDEHGARQGLAELLCNLELPAARAPQRLLQACAKLERRGGKPLVALEGERVVLTRHGRCAIDELRAELESSATLRVPSRAQRMRAGAFAALLGLASVTASALPMDATAAETTNTVGASEGAGPPPAPSHRPLRENAPQQEPPEPTEPKSFSGYDGARPFSVTSRKDKLTFYPCTACHSQLTPNPTPRKLASPHPAALNHGKGRMWCTDCHTLKDRDALHTVSGAKVDFDDSHLLCGQCHGNRHRDWHFGAHGKRAENWTGERTLYNCTHCHDPHDPTIKPREPSKAPPVRARLEPMQRIPHETPPVWVRNPGAPATATQ
jgi:oxygen-independent coproporphyrinogen-3 oxidase